ncbi:M15 family metallopeptidase [Rheinheimera muenzenbergensis]|uniref:M15 family metallopeptidase n=1 Tax=Rheinheimera muenzenbergensis TaxID=1193628 RepID=A0ABU8C7H0_9GAMM
MARDTEMEHLHPLFRQKVELLLQDLAKAKLPFRMFEGFRSPQRQHDLYCQGRTKPGAKVTNADAWSSLHQYGVAADFVLYIDGKWSWDDKGERKAWWKKLHQLALQHQLEPLSWELPHLQLQQMQLAQLRAGKYPADGDADWAENLQHAIATWRGTPGAPPMPLAASGRPPLPANAPEPQSPATTPNSTARLATVTARDGLRLRAGPGTQFDIKTTLRSGQQVYVLASSGDWSQIDIEGDGLADGYCHSGYLAVNS